jgi:formamidase
MEYLQKFGYSHEQAYMIMAVAPIEAKVLTVPNIPTANVSVGLPTQIFNFGVRPSEEGPKARDRVSGAYFSPSPEETFLREKKAQESPFHTL